MYTFAITPDLCGEMVTLPCGKIAKAESNCLQDWLDAVSAAGYKVVSSHYQTTGQKGSVVIMQKER